MIAHRVLNIMILASILALSVVSCTTIFYASEQPRIPDNIHTIIIKTLSAEEAKALCVRSGAIPEAVGCIRCDNGTCLIITNKRLDCLHHELDHVIAMGWHDGWDAT